MTFSDCYKNNQRGGGEASKSQVSSCTVAHKRIRKVTAGSGGAGVPAGTALPGLLYIFKMGRVGDFKNPQF